MNTLLIYNFTALLLFAAGLRGALLRHSVIGQIISINVCGCGLFLWMVTLAFRGDGEAANALMHALVLTGIVIAVSASALALAIDSRLQQAGETAEATDAGDAERVTERVADRAVESVLDKRAGGYE